MKIAVIGASGMLGASIVNELLDRDHVVTGIVRNVDKLALRPGLTPVCANLLNPGEITAALRGHEVVICAFAPGRTMTANVYKGAVEGAWRIKRAIKAAAEPYLIYVGNAGSLWTSRHNQVIDDPSWSAWRLNAANAEYLRHLHRMTTIGTFGSLMQEGLSVIASGGKPHAHCAGGEPHVLMADMGARHELAQGCRAAFEIFSDDHTLPWSFVSPPCFLMPGPRTGKYRITIDELPLEEGNPAGISVADMAVAIADEAEALDLIFKHWCAARASSV